VTVRWTVTRDGWTERSLYFSSPLRRRERKTNLASSSKDTPKFRLRSFLFDVKKTGDLIYFNHEVVRLP